MQGIFIYTCIYIYIYIYILNIYIYIHIILNIYIYICILYNMLFLNSKPLFPPRRKHAKKKTQDSPRRGARDSPRRGARRQDFEPSRSFKPPVIDNSLGWFKGKSTGNHGFYH